MAAKPGPLPPADFASRDLPVETVPAETVPAGTAFVRIHRTGLGAVYFGTSGDNRFDSPDRSYGVCYAACTLEGAFAGTCLRQVGATLVSLATLAVRSVSVIVTTAELRLVALHGQGLARLGATAFVSSGRYDVSQPWSAAIHRHGATVDGIVYRSNHDNGERCVALFDRCRTRLEEGAPEPLAHDRKRLAALLDRYGIGIA